MAYFIHIIVSSDLSHKKFMPKEKDGIKKKIAWAFRITDKVVLLTYYALIFMTINNFPQNFITLYHHFNV